MQMEYPYASVSATVLKSRLHPLLKIVDTLLVIYIKWMLVYNFLSFKFLI